MIEFDCLSRSSYTNNTLFLEASAGSGKTFAIQNLFVRMILGVDNGPVSIDQILVVTFTKAATKELKCRIYQALLDVRHCLSCYLISDFDYLNKYIEEGDVERPLKLIKRAISQIEELQVFTIHGFCLKFLKDFSFDVQFLDEEDDVTIQTIILDELRALSCLVLHPLQLKILMRSCRMDFKLLLKKIEDFLDPSIQFTGKVCLEQFVTTDFFKNYSKELVYEDLIEYSRFYNRMLTKQKQLRPDFVKQLDLCFESKKIEDFILFDSLFFEIIAPENEKKKASGSIKLHYPYLIDTLRKELLPIIEEARNPDSILLKLVSHIAPKILQKLKKYPAVFPDLLLHRMKEALEKSEFISQVRSRFLVAIVDEFQDTDPEQWQIFRKIFLQSDHSFLGLIGDPKQSIYSFRGADLSVYMEAKREIGDKACRILKKNYRSLAPLVDVFNTLFEADTEVFSFDEPLNYIPSLAIKHEEGAAPHLVFSLYEEPASRSKIIPSLFMEEDRILPFIGSEIVSLALSGASLKDIAILVKDRHQAKRVSSYLYKMGISSVSTRSVSLVQTDCFLLIKQFLQAVYLPLDEGALKSFLYHKWACLPLDKGMDFWHLQFSYFKEVYLKEGIGALMNLFCSLEDGWILNRFLSAPHLGLYSDLQKIIQILVDFEAKKGPSLVQLLRYLDNLRWLDPDLSSIVKRELILEEDAVSIMTVHMSKGLEFEYVFALGPCCRGQQTPDLIKMNSKVFRKEKNKDLLDIFMKKSCGEKMRLLYVALTRAKKRAYAFCIFSSSRVALDTASPMELFFAKKLAKDASYDSFLEALFSQDKVSIEHLLKNFSQRASMDYIWVNETIFSKFISNKEDKIVPPLRSVVFKETPIEYLSFSKLASHSLTSSKKEEPEFPAGALVGTVLHEMIEEIMKVGEFENIYGLVEKKCSLTPLEGREKEVEKLLLDLFNMEILDGLLVSNISNQSMLEEVEFSFMQGNKQIKGFIDLVFEYKDKFYIIDWKSNFLGNEAKDYERPSLLKEFMEKNYDLQADIYAGALKRYLIQLGIENFSEVFGGAIYIFLRGAPFGLGALHIEVCNYARVY
jgi:exodeoxyribonuclease V beta subunit